MEVSVYFKNILKQQSQIGYKMPTYLQAPADKILINQAEAQLNLVFNDELKELYSVANGILDSNFFGGRTHTEIFDGYQFLSISSAIEYYHCFVYDTPSIKLFPIFADDAGDVYWIDLNKGDFYGKIYWTNTLAIEPDYLFNSLSSMIKTIWECYRDSVIILDENGTLECDYSKWGTYAERNSVDLGYWKNYNKS